MKTKVTAVKEKSANKGRQDVVKVSGTEKGKGTGESKRTGKGKSKAKGPCAKSDGDNNRAAAAVVPTSTTEAADAGASSPRSPPPPGLSPRPLGPLAASAAKARASGSSWTPGGFRGKAKRRAKAMVRSASAIAVDDAAGDGKRKRRKIVAETTTTALPPDESRAAITTTTKAAPRVSTPHIIAPGSALGL